MEGRLWQLAAAGGAAWSLVALRLWPEAESCLLGQPPPRRTTATIPLSSSSPAQTQPAGSTLELVQPDSVLSTRSLS